MSTLLVSGSGSENFAVSPDGAAVYIAGNDGTLKSYSTATGSLLQSWQVGTDLGGIAISPDGTTALLVEDTPKSTHQTNDWPSNTTVTQLFEVDLATG